MSMCPSIHPSIHPSTHSPDRPAFQNTTPAMKRKRGNHDGTRAAPVGVSSKQLAAADQSPNATPPLLHHHPHPVLHRLYPQLSTLRHYLLSRLPSSSKNRQRRIALFGHAPRAPAHTQTSDTSPVQHVDYTVAQLLDSALVGCAAHVTAQEHALAAKERDQDLHTFTQQRSQSTPGATYKPGYYKQPEIVDYVIWRLFTRSSSYRPAHVLCHGFQRAARARSEQHHGPDTRASIPGLQQVHDNSHVQTLKDPVWCQIHALLGQSGDRIMMDLLLDCAIFLPVEANMGNYYQLSGMPLSEVQLDRVVSNGPGNPNTNIQPIAKTPHLHSEDRTPGSIAFVRSRMLYAKAALNANGGVRFGLRHIHVLNRYPDRADKQQTVHIMRYIFPRQFGLHNVFTSKVDARESAMPFKDYTLREKDIHTSMCRQLGDKATDADQVAKWKLRVPRRLRGNVMTLIEKLRILNQRCSYTELLRHYCPIEGIPLSAQPESKKSVAQSKANLTTATQLAQCDRAHSPVFESSSIQQTCFLDMACPAAHVSAFCRRVISKVIPKAAWGDDHNEHIVMYWIDQFVALRRFESLTLHQVTQKIHITTISWLCPPNQDNDHKLSKSDLDKRTEIFLEFVYWIFDSFLIPLIRTNFHVTESNTHRNRLFYFRHDVWRMFAEPALKTLRLNMFEELPKDRATKLLSARQLGFSDIRLLPKKQGFRTIMNLRRRQQVLRHGAMALGRSINTVMTPAFNAINYEKSLQPDKFGCSLFSVGDMLPKLTAFRNSIKQRGLDNKPFYFAKVDVQACFDSIPQSRLLSMVESLLSVQEYRTSKHVEMFALGPLQRLNGNHVDPMPRKRFVTYSHATTDVTPFHQLVRDRFLGTKANIVFANMNMQRCETKDDLMYLLREHIERNVVRIGKRFYRQKTGIPQGSVLSSILCNFFYAELERDILDFALGDDCLLLRLLDDFLLISITEEHARRFVQVMHQGHPDYGVVVQPAKSLANFDVTIATGERVATTGSGGKFPYCGVCIDTTTLEISKKTERPPKAVVEDSLTVDLAKMPGQTFHRKALNAFKIQLKAMLIDSSLNSVSTVLANVYQSFYEAAVRCLEYARVLSRVRKMGSGLLVKTVKNIITLAYVMLQRRSRSCRSREAIIAQSVISRRQLQWLGCKAFQAAFQGKQTRHRALLGWLKDSLSAACISSEIERRMLEDVVAGR